MARASTSWKKGQSGNPGGRVKSIVGKVHRLAKDTGHADWLAEALLQALTTGALSLRKVDVGTGLEREGYSLEFAEWFALLRYVWPEQKQDKAQGDEDAESLYDALRSRRAERVKQSA